MSTPFYQQVKDTMGEPDEEAARYELITKQPMISRWYKKIYMSEQLTQKWYQSRTMWVGILTTLGGAVEFVLQYIQGDISLGALITAIIGLSVSYLRLDTKKVIVK